MTTAGSAARLIQMLRQLVTSSVHMSDLVGTSGWPSSVERGASYSSPMRPAGGDVGVCAGGESCGQRRRVATARRADPRRVALLAPSSFFEDAGRTLSASVTRRGAPAGKVRQLAAAALPATPHLAYTFMPTDPAHFLPQPSLRPWLTYRNPACTPICPTASKSTHLCIR